MAKITVGVPVFNGAASLRTCLECLRDQSFRDIEVIIADNGSQDESVAIAQAFVDSDPRFRLIRHASNIGAKANFLSVLEAASCELFMWRADDAWSDADFIEKLAQVFTRNPDIALAVPKIRILHHDGSLWQDQMFLVSEKNWQAARIGDTMLAFSANAIYGLWRREPLLASMKRGLLLYPPLSGWDHITTFPFVLDELVAGTNDTMLVLRSNPAPREPDRFSAFEMFAMRRNFRLVSLMALRERKWTFCERVVLEYYTRRYAAKNIYRFSKTLRHLIRSTLGIQRKRRKRTA